MEFILKPFESSQEAPDFTTDYYCTNNTVAECGCVYNDVAGCACPKK